MALKALAAERITIDNTAGGVGITAALITAGVIRAYCKVETAQIRIQTDPDTTVTAGGTEGSPIKDIGDSFYIYGQPDLSNFRAIRTGAVDGYIHVILEGAG